jgi:hypothetical protein
MKSIRTIKCYLILFFVLFFFNGFSQRGPEHHIDTLKVGFYITSIRNIDFLNSSFNVDAWVWLHYKNPEIYCANDEIRKIYPDCLEWINDITEQTNEKKDPFVDNKNDKLVWSSFKINRKFRKKWNLSSYPFDIQNIEIKLESSDFENKDLVLTTETAKIDSTFIANEKEWIPIISKSDSFKPYTNTYQTSFGDPKNLNRISKYSGVSYSFDIIRLNRWTTFFKLFTGILISFLIALSVFLIKPTNLDARFGLVVGALFSSIGSKYIVDSMIPVYYENTLFDNIHNATFIYIFIITILSIISLNLMERSEIKSQLISIKLDKISFFTCFFSYLIVISLLVNGSIQK